MSNINFACLTKNQKYNESLAYDLSTSSADCDTNLLLPQTEEKETVPVIKMYIAEVLKNHFKLFIAVCDVFSILIFTLVLLSINTLKCENFKRKDILEWCKPFEPVDKIIVDLNFDLLVHCDTPKSCVAYAEILMEKHRYNYNFIIGDEELVYVGKGYQCGSDSLRLQMLITRYTWDPKQPVYRIPEEVVVRYSEIIQEGIWCGKIAPNFTVIAHCSVYGEWCRAANIRDQIPWTQPAPLSLAHDNRNPWFEQPHGHHPFFAFDVTRVYDRFYRLKSCNRTQY